MKKSLAIGLFICIGLPVLSSASAVAIQSPTSTVSLGTPVSVIVNVAGMTDLYAFQFDIDFNPAVLSASSVAEGSLFSSVGVFFSPGFIDNTAGAITFISDSLSGPGPGISTDGTLATIMFNSIGAGSSPLTLANVVLLDSNLNDITAAVSGASVKVAASAIPEPSSFSLMIAAFALVLAGGKARVGV